MGYLGGSSSFEISFLDTLRKNFLMQHIDKPTRATGTDIPHILGLIISEDHFIDNIIYDSPLGKSDHCVLKVDCKVNTNKKNYIEKYALSKADFDGLQDSLQIDWCEMLLQYDNDIEGMWQVFKSTLENKIEQFVPKVKNFDSWKKESWIRPLNAKVTDQIHKKTSAGYILFYFFF